MTTYTPGERVHVKTPLGSSPGFDQEGTYVERDGNNSHKVLLDGWQSPLYFWSHEVTPIAETKTLIESAGLFEVLNALSTSEDESPGRRYTITFEENEA